MTLFPYRTANPTTAATTPANPILTTIPEAAPSEFSGVDVGPETVPLLCPVVMVWFPPITVVLFVVG